MLVLLVVRPPRRAVGRLERAARGRTAVATALVGGGLMLAIGIAALPFAAFAHERAVDFGQVDAVLGASGRSDLLKSSGDRGRAGGRRRGAVRRA